MTAKKKKGEEQKESRQTSFLIIDSNRIAEQVYNPEKKIAQFVVWDKNKGYYQTGIGNINYKFVDRIDSDNIIYHPIKNEALEKKAVLLPATIQSYVDTRSLMEEIKEYIYTYCDVSDTFLNFCSWYVLFSWVYDRFNTVPYLRLRGDTGTGKTRTLDTVGGLCYKPCFIAGAVTPAPIYRMISQWSGTLIIDEADFRESDAQSEIIKILNCGYQKGKPVLRCKQNDADTIQTFETYCPKLIGTREDFTDKALESRCLTEITAQTDREDIPVDLPQKFFEKREELRNRLLCWRLSNWHKIDPDASLKIELGNLEPRLRQATGSFASLFANMPEMLEDFKAFMRKYQAELIAERSESNEGLIVNAIARLIVFGQRDINATTIITEMSGHMKDATPVKVGKHLKSLHIQTKLQRVEGKTKRIVVLDSALRKVFKRYISDPDLLAECNRVTGVTEYRGQSAPLKKGCNRNALYPHSSVTPVTLVTDVQGIINLVKAHPERDNAILIEENCDKAVIEEALKLGFIIENPSGTYRTGD